MLTLAIFICTTCLINILRTDLRTKMILARPQSVGKITKTTTQLEFKKHYSNKAPHYQGRGWAKGNSVPLEIYFAPELGSMIN